MSADRLREAARVLRERAEVATPGPWRVTGDSLSPYNDVVVADHASGNPSFAEGVADTDTSDENAAYIATVSPAFALAAADWLDEHALYHARGQWNCTRGSRCPSLAVADAVLGAGADR